MKEFLFYLVILLANTIQGITGFAGTILAMPFSIMLVGYNTAKPVLNVLGLLSGIYVFAGNRKAVDWKELGKIVLVMAGGMLFGFFLKSRIPGEHMLLLTLGIIVILLAVEGLVRTALHSEAPNAEVDNGKCSSLRGSLLLISAGVVHGMFVCGGPLLIGYLSKKIKDKQSFRATISTVWISLNSIILAQDVAAGLWNPGLVVTQVVSIPFLFAGMFIGGRLFKVMSRKVFMILTYVLLLISGVSLILK